jgi:phenylalanyl-tRNA synthetase beta chain
MRIPLSWLKDFVKIDLPVEELAHRLTLAGIEVEALHFVGLPLPEGIGTPASGHRHETYITGLAWDPETIVIGELLEVMPHPNADRLVLCRLNDGVREHTVLTGAPNLFEYKGKGPLANPLKVAYAREGARLYDGHKPGQELMVLKRARIRGIDSYSMACSEKELGISDEHEGIIMLDSEAPTGMSLAEYMGDVVLDFVITPNIARVANVLGLAREVAAVTGQELQEPDYQVDWTGPEIEGQVSVEIRQPELNPRFVLGLIEGVKIAASPYWVQRRLRLAGMRPINNIVDATNYAMLEIGEPLHAFDYDVLVKRADDASPRIITRLPQPGEMLTTLDGVERRLDEFTVLVADEQGALSIAGVMGGAESEVGPATRAVLLEGAAWNFINIRRTVAAQKLDSEAAYRFARGVHPAMAERGVRRGLSLMEQLAGGTVARGLVDNYPLPPQVEAIELAASDVQRLIGIELATEEMAGLLERLGFDVERQGGKLRVVPPDHRLDIGQGIVGRADVMEEIIRLYGYDWIPETQIGDTIPPQHGNPALQREEALRDLLVALGLQEVITYRLTSPEREARATAAGLGPDPQGYVRLANPIAADRGVMRQRLLPSVLESVERNWRISDRLQLFEIGPVFRQTTDVPLPEEELMLAIAVSGYRQPAGWQEAERSLMDFFDLKGLIQAMLERLKTGPVEFLPAEHPTCHPGKCARVMVDAQEIGRLGELHPLVAQAYEFQGAPVLVAEFELDKLLAHTPDRYPVVPVPTFPPVLEDLAFIVREEIPAATVERMIWEAGGPLLKQVRLFDLYRGDQIGEENRSLAYALVYQAGDRTLTDEEVAAVRNRIVAQLHEQLGARLRA